MVLLVGCIGNGRIYVWVVRGTEHLVLMLMRKKWINLVNVVKFPLKKTYIFFLRSKTQDGM